jgi:hypothetical protein
MVDASVETAGANGFWSYAHLDDEAEGGRISKLAAAVSREYELLTAQPLELFLDRDSIALG